jgi:hypothetical protein
VIFEGTKLNETERGWTGLGIVLGPVEGLLGCEVSRPRLRYGLGYEEKYIEGELGLAWGKDVF